MLSLRHALIIVLFVPLLTGACGPGRLGTGVRPGSDAAADRATADSGRHDGALEDSGPRSRVDAAAPADAGLLEVDAGVTTVVEVLCRESWGAAAPAGAFRDHLIERLTVHHTAVSLADNSMAPARLRGHQRYHQQDLGWPDLAYHFAVDRNGHVYEGRPVLAVGDTGTAYDPAGHFLVVAEGDFQTQSPTASQVAAIASLLAWASQEYVVSADLLGGHRDFADTTCPGASLAVFLEDGTLRAAIDERLAAGPMQLRFVCDEEASATIDRIVAGTDDPYAWP
jgi:hypothetical protein